jgi:FMN phosphatase YigB (HAD superfamily)
MMAVLLDVGGTIWPDAWPSQGLDDPPRVARLQRVLPELTAATANGLVEALRRALVPFEGALLQDTDAAIAEGMRRSGLPNQPGLVIHVRRAMCVPAAGRIDLFPGARALLKRIRELGMTCAVVSNAGVRDCDDYRRDFTDLGISGEIDAIVTSVETGYRKPHPKIFEAALVAAGCPAAHCVMIGNSERNDVAPALALGMRAVRVAIEEDQPAESAAHAVATSLDQITALLTEWAIAAASGG